MKNDKQVHTFKVNAELSIKIEPRKLGLATRIEGVERVPGK